MAPLIDWPRALPLDVSVVRPEELTTMHRAIVSAGHLLGGEVVAVPPVRWPEWGYTMAALAYQDRQTMPAAAALGGQLYLDLGGERIEPDLRPGDVVVFDSAYLHGVTAVEAGERVVLVSHSVTETR